MNHWKKLGFAGLTAIAFTLAGQQAQAACINSLDNTVDDPTDCIFATGGATDNCRLAISVDMDGTGEPPLDPKKINCTDGDPACDDDGAVNGTCSFRVGVCVNLPVGGCAADTVSGHILKKPSLKEANDALKRPNSAGNRNELEAAIQALLPNGGEACTDANIPVKVDLKSKGGECAESEEKCVSDLDCIVPGNDTDSCMPIVKKNKVNIDINVTDSVDDYSAKFKLNCIPAVAPFANGAEALIATAPDLIGGPLAVGKVGDKVIRNGNIRAVIRNPGREHSFGLLHGGQIIDADLVREDPADDRDSWGGMQPLVNISSTQGTDTVTVENDGSDGMPAIVSSSGPDDLFDPIKGDVIILSNPPLNVPPAATDVNSNVQVSTNFILNPYSRAIQMATTVTNNGGTNLAFYIGDYLTPSGQTEPFGPGQGYGETQLRNGATAVSGGQALDLLAFQGGMDAAGLTYGIVWAPTNLGNRSTQKIGCFTQSGFYACVHNQDLFSTLLAGPTAKPPGGFPITASGGKNTMRRWFVVGETVADITKVRTEIFDRPKSALQGFVTGPGGVAVEGAHVTISNDDANNVGGCPSPGICNNVYSSTLTDEHGFYRFVVPEGIYDVAVRKTGTPYEGGGSTPVQTSVELEEKKTTVHSMTLPGTAQLVVNSEDQGGIPVAAKVSIVGVPASPDPLNTENSGIGGINFVGRYFGFNFEEKGDIFGIVDNRFTDLSGTTGTFDLEPGTYHIVVSKGYEYDVFEQRVTLASGANPAVDAVVNKVVDTTGFASMDNHVHSIESLDSTISDQRRILSMIAEGVDYFSNTDHDFLHDMSGDISDMLATGLIANSPGTEITTSHYGHFNVWPQVPVPAQYDGGAFDWSFHLGEVNGLTYPSDLAYDNLPGEIFGAFNPATQVIQVNHFNSGTLGHFNSLGIDTELAAPLSSNDVYRCVGGTEAGLPCQIKICLGGGNDGNTCTLPGDCPGGSCGAGASCDGGGTCTASANNLSSFLRLDPAVANLYDDGFTALEVWIEAGRGQTETFLSENMGDWFNLMNQGNFKAGVADSDTHSNFNVQAGGPRTWVASSSDDPATINPAELAVNTNAMRAIGSNGPFMTVELENGSAATASHALGDSRTVVATAAPLSNSINIHLEAPTWAQYDTIDVYINAVPSCQSEWTFFGVINPSSCDTVTPTLTFTKDDGDPGVDPDEFVVTTALGVSGFGTRQLTDLSILRTVAADSWVVVVARGTDGVSAPLFPMQPQDLDDTPNTDVDDLTDNDGPLPWNLGEEGALALVYSNPLWFDDPSGNNVCHGGTTCPGL